MLTFGGTAGGPGFAANLGDCAASRPDGYLSVCLGARREVDIDNELSIVEPYRLDRVP